MGHLGMFKNISAGGQTGRSPDNKKISKDSKMKKTLKNKAFLPLKMGF